MITGVITLTSISGNTECDMPGAIAGKTNTTGAMDVLKVGINITKNANTIAVKVVETATETEMITETVMGMDVVMDVGKIMAKDTATGIND